MKIIRTVLGDIPADQLGFTSVHEHTICDPSALKRVLIKSMPGMMKGATAYQGGADIGAEMERRKKEGIDNVPQMDIRGIFRSMRLPHSNPASRLTDVSYYAGELKAFREHGGQAVCDCSPLPFGGPALNKIQELSRVSGVHIISCAGYYTKAAIPKSLYRKGEAFLQQRIEELLMKGDGTCDARPGAVKCAVATVENGQIAAVEQMAVRACARAAKTHGMALHIHNAFPVRKEHILKLADMLEKEIGLSPERVIFCHMDSYNLGMGNPAARINRDGYDAELPLKLAARGFYVGLDTWSVTSSDEAVRAYSVNARKKLLLELVEKGAAKQITLGHDMMSRAAGVQNGRYGYTFFPDILKEMVRRGELSEKVFRLLTVDNPARVLSM